MLAPGTYTLGDHPDGNAAPPTYGLRLDELVNVTTGHDIFTFSFDHPDADMRLDITPAGIDVYEVHIHGTAYGGLVQGHQYNPSWVGLADIDFVYMMTHPVAGDPDDLIVTTPSFTNTGSITWDNMTIDLFDRASADGYTFRMGNDDDDAGYRGYDGISGWGWLDHGTPGVHIASSDWLFTVVPTPGSTALLAVALAIVAARRRRATRSTG